MSCGSSDLEGVHHFCPCSLGLFFWIYLSWTDARVDVVCRDGQLSLSVSRIPVMITSISLSVTSIPLDVTSSPADAFRLWPFIFTQGQSRVSTSSMLKCPQSPSPVALE